eukprot:TRINITY_DN2558_c0_g1_i8.p3 TRINITY_DN2558_c0_g1~~TRINITY_DN2558_c0_g1_i8.p3  ORF type:complete len:108 (-),score=25.87 TRINITY_DN2558_c0_g1_i8:1258-1581(-)
MIPGPVEQNVYGKGGVYELLLIPKKSLHIRDYKRANEKMDKETDGKSVEEVEDRFWETVSFRAPVYGADMEGSLFDAEVPWNLGNLPSLLKSSFILILASNWYPVLA